MISDTIAAIATAMSDSGIGIIRISGDQAFEIGDAVFRTPGGKKILREAQTHTIHYGYIVDPKREDERIDEVLVSVMRGPKSFTAEDTVEINCHGGVQLLRKVLEICLENGARMAQPGEFTKRAFLNGRIDLAKAEAVMDLIHSQSDIARRSSLSQLQGNLSDKIRDLRKGLLYEIAFIESALDDPEHISLDGYPEKLQKIVTEYKDKIQALRDTFSDGILIKEGISTVILGKPNAGKSSLMNLLLGEDRAIVTDVAGTTRDALQESIRLHGISLNLIDTAGIRETEDLVEKIGVEKAKQFAERADLILCVADTSVDLDESDEKIFSLLENKRSIILMNKNDLDAKFDEESILQKYPALKNCRFVRTSTKDGVGMDELEEAVRDLFFKGLITSSTETVITNIRHKNALDKAYESLVLVLGSIESGMPEDFYSIDLMSAYSSLGLIIGEEVGDDLTDEIFSKFCMGK